MKKRAILRNIKLIEGDDKVRQKKCSQAIVEFFKQSQITAVPEFLISGTDISQRLKLIMPDSSGSNISDPNNILGETQAQTHVQEILDQFDCIMIPEFTAIDGRISHGVKVRVKPRIKGNN